MSNQYQSYLTTHRMGSSWQIRHNRYTFLFGFDLQNATLTTAPLSGNNSLRREYINWLPQLMVQPRLGPSQYLQIHYQTGLAMPSVLQLQPVTDVTNPLFLRLGNPALRPEYAHSLNVTYNSFQTATFRSVYAFMNVGLTQNRIVTATTVDAYGVQTSQPVNTNGYWTMNGTLTMDRSLVLGTLQNKASWTSVLQLIRSNTYSNSQLNRSTSLYASQSLGLNTSFTNQLEASVIGSTTYQQVFSSLSQPNKAYLLSWRLAARLALPLPFGVKLSTELIYTRKTGLAASYNQQYMLWNSFMSWSFLKHQQGELRLQCYDLLNQNQSVVRTITETYVEDTQGRVLRRYALLSFVYNLKQFGSAPKK